MKKTVSLMLTAMLAGQFLMAQVPAGIKFLNYEKNKSAKEAFQKAVDANPKDGQAIYWLGQALLANEATEVTKEQIAAAKELYRKGLQDIGSDPWLLVGMGHVEMLEKGDMNAVKQKFEQAITASTETKGKNKGKPSADILNAIGRAGAFVPSGTGDHPYMIDKLKQAAVLDPTNPDIMVNMGINYLKMGGENGGEAVKAYQDATVRDPKNARAFYRIGRIYLSQNNKELFEQNFNAAIAADPTFPPVYIAYFNYYSNRDVNVAKDYLDKYVANADKLPENDLYVANYLFLSGKYAESLAKTKELDAAIGNKTLPKINLLYALNYDRSGDSLQAKSSLEKYFANTPADQINPSDIELAVKVFSKIPGSETQAIAYIEKAMTLDTTKASKMKYLGQIADIYGKAKMYPQQIDYMKRAIALRGGPLSEFEYYTFTNIAFNAKDYPLAIENAKQYMTAFPASKQPYTFLRKAALASDPDTLTGAGIDAINFLDSMYTVVDKEKYKKDIFINQFYILSYYYKKLSALSNSPDWKITTSGRSPVVDEYLALAQQKVVTLLDTMATLYPDPNDDNNKFVQTRKADILKRIDYYSKPPQPVRKTTTGGGAGGAAGKGE